MSMTFKFMISSPDSQNRRGLGVRFGKCRKTKVKSLREVAETALGISSVAGFIASVVLTKSGQIGRATGRGRACDQGGARKKFSGEAMAEDRSVERQIACTRGKWDWFLSGSRAPAGRSRGWGLRGHGFMFNAESIAIASYMRKEPTRVPSRASSTFTRLSAAAKKERERERE